MILIFSLLISSVFAHGNHGKDFDFVGKQHWAEEYIDFCDSEQFGLYKQPDLFCTRYLVDYAWVNMEVLSQSPILIQYHKFYSNQDSDALRDYVEHRELELQQVLHNDDIREAHTSRRANGTWFEHYENDVATRVFDYARRRMPSINFHSSELWHALSYLPGGHYAPHYDYIEYESEAVHDYWMKNYGNRMATFLVILKTADEGGGTIFPYLRYTVKPKKGDVIFWFNMEGNGSQAQSSLHGACPIIGGQKMAATLWIRQRGNELSMTLNNEGEYDLNLLTQPKLETNFMSFRGKDIYL